MISPLRSRYTGYANVAALTRGTTPDCAFMYRKAIIKVKIAVVLAEDQTGIPEMQVKSVSL